MDPYQVFVVLDQEYGERLSELAGKGPVWIVDTQKNRAAAQALWVTDPSRSHLDGVTTFKMTNDCSPEEVLINELDTIDLHHGIHSADPPYTILEVVGTPINARVRTRLSEFGFDQFEGTSGGFVPHVHCRAVGLPLFSQIHRCLQVPGVRSAASIQKSGNL